MTEAELDELIGMSFEACSESPHSVMKWEGEMVEIEATATLDPISSMAMTVVGQLRSARQALVFATSIEAEWKRTETLSRAYAEQRLIANTEGGEKALGTNEAARARAFAIALNSDAPYQPVLQKLIKASEEAAIAEANVRSLQDELSVLRAAMLRDGKAE